MEKQYKPFLQEKVVGGRHHVTGALVNWIVVIAVFLFYRPLFAKGKPEVSPEQVQSSSQTSTNLLQITPVVATNAPTMTPYSTHTPYPSPTMTPTPAGIYREFLYSYYDPTLGGVNCRNWNDLKGECDSLMASGEDWQVWYTKAVACPLDIPLWTIIKVVEPASIAAEYVCLDRGGMLGTRYLDFLDYYQRLPWNEVVKAYLFFPAR